MPGAPGAARKDDPCFWLIHSYVDLLAEKWWRCHATQDKHGLKDTSLPKSGGPRGGNKGDIIEPNTDVTNGDMAVSSRQLGYRYQQ